MRYVASLLGGLIVGVGSALALIYFNPLTLSQSEPSSDPEWVLEYKLAADNIWLSTHNNRPQIPIVPKTAPLLWEDGIRGSWLAAMPLAAGSGTTTAAGTRISIPSPRTEFVSSGLLVEDHWLISVPDSGTFYVHAVNNQWPLVRDTIVRVGLLGREFTGPGNYDSTRGPGDDGALVVGMTGQYKSTHGKAHDRLSLQTYDGSLGAVSGQLLIALTDDNNNN